MRHKAQPTRRAPQPVTPQTAAVRWAPTLPSPLRAASELPDGSLLDGVIAETELTRVELPRSRWSRTEIRACRFEAGLFQHAHFEGVTFESCVLHNCDLTGARFDACGLSHVVFSHCRLDGFTAMDTSFDGVIVDDSNLSLANFRFLKTFNILFKESMLVEVDFTGTRLERALFQKCNLRQADFTQVTATGVDFRGSELDEIRGVASLKGATIGRLQLFGLALSLARDAGITVAEDD
jgi:uncharacterized protein YjbI with pentapeptide repeats